MKNLTPAGLANIETLKTLLKHRLRDKSKTKSLDASGNVVYVDVSIFEDEALDSFLTLALSDFNQVPNFTSFTFEDTEIIDRNASLIVLGAFIYCLSSQALVEKGREFSINDDGVAFTPPSVADTMMAQYEVLLSIYWKKLKLIKSFY